MSSKQQQCSEERIITCGVFNRFEYDPFIDYLKGICIILVIFTHGSPDWLKSYSLFPIWGSPAVPLFLLIQVFHTYKKGLNKATVSYVKLWRRIIKPFLIMEFFIICALLLIQSSSEDFDVFLFIRKTISGGGRGLGSYYPWIYVQFALLLPFIAPIINRLEVGGVR